MDDPEFYSNVPVSRPVIITGDQVKDFGGFVWSSEGIRIGLAAIESDPRNVLLGLREDVDAKG